MKPPSLLAAAVIGGSVILAAVAFALVAQLLRGADELGTGELVARLERELAGQGREIRVLRAEVEALAEKVAAAGAARPAPAPPVTGRPEAARSAEPPAPGQLAGGETPVPGQVANGGTPALTDGFAGGRAPVPLDPVAAAAAPAELDQFGGAAAPPETEGLIDQMQLASDRFNQGVERPRPSLLQDLLGAPRETYGEDCQPVTNPRLVAALETRQVGGFRVTMLRPALDSFEAVIDRLRREEPDILAALGTAGALCARYVRGSRSSVSSHAWGAAVDLTLKGDLDRMGDASTQFGLVVLAEFFNEAGWYWGAAYGREDSMHFEVGAALLRRWVAEGRL